MNEDLNAQLLTRCINEGKTLVNDTKEKSLATELEHLTKEEVQAEPIQDNFKTGTASWQDKLYWLILNMTFIFYQT